MWIWRRGFQTRGTPNGAIDRCPSAEDRKTGRCSRGRDRDKPRSRRDRSYGSGKKEPSESSGVRDGYCNGERRLQSSPADDAPATFTQIRNAAIEGYRTVIDGIVSVAIFLASYGPSILFWGLLLFFPVRSLWKRLRATMRRPTA
jgi:hypothetical protein